VADAVVIGAGPNGLVAANLLADEGWDVQVLEAHEDVGGAVRTEELARPGFHSDVFSAFYPLASASPVIRALDLESHGLEWRTAPLVLAHPLADGRCAVLSTDIDETAASFDAFAPGDGRAWRRIFDHWEEVGEPFMAALMSPFPPLRDGARLAGRLGAGGALRFARQSILPVRTMGEEEFAGEGGRLILAGNALHADLSPESALSGMFGWLLTCIGQERGYPVPRGGAARLVEALRRRLEARGGRVETSTPVNRVVVRGGRAQGVITAGGDEIPAGKAVLADVGAPALYRRLVGPEHLPPRVLDDLRRFHYDNGTVKVDWALSGTVPWRAHEARRAGTVHLCDSVDALTMQHAAIATGTVPADPFLVIGQMTTADDTRSPEGTEAMWAYTHVPQHVSGDEGGSVGGRWSEREVLSFADRMEEAIERHAPGFRDLVLDRHVLAPPDFEDADGNLVGGALNGGTAQLHQQLVFRPLPGLARAETPVRGLFLASASAHPGGGVHGGPGSNAARAALAHARARTATRICFATVTGGAAAWLASGRRRPPAA
jgi:phytoene dehydrogenase-like protein